VYAERRAEGAPAEALREARVATRQLLGEVRDVVGELRHERAFDLKRALARLLVDAPGLEVEFTLSPDLDVRDPTAAHALFRCAQETLTNTIRHAGASRMWIDLRQDADGIRLKTRDDGCGAPGLREGNGLRGMRERIESLGGRLELASPRGSGLELAVWLPTPGGRG
jgi:signal transduction histidine kinase